MLDPEHTKTLAYELAHRSLARVIVETGVLVLIALTALVGNSCVLYVFYKTPRLRSVTSYYIITLAIADIFQAIITMPVSISFSASGRDVLGPRLGQGEGFISAILINGTLMIIGLIGINRYYCVAKPNVYKKIFKPKIAWLTIVGVFAFVLCALAFTFFIGWMDFEYYPGLHLYYITFSSRVAAVSFLAVLVILVVVFPFASIIICYKKINQVIKQHNANVASTLHAETMTAEEINLSVSLLALVCGFVICWIPTAIIYILLVFLNLPRSVELIAIYMAYISSAINPIVYNIFNKPFRKEFVAMFS